ncbi:MAG: VWA domain-containing protein [Acidobacteriia bacterium]|nr:VWA domain-containing protein [Terriglobia bacterium]
MNSGNISGLQWVTLPAHCSLGVEEVLVGREQLDAPGAALLVAYPGEPAETILPVMVYPDGNVPARALVTSEELIKKLGLWGNNRPHWQLRFGGFDSPIAREICLEMASEQSIDQASQLLAFSKELPGRMIYTAAQASAAGQLLEVESVPFRIRSLVPAAVRDTVYTIEAPHTQVSLFASSQRVGVDVVILADCSGSMSIPDLTETMEGETGASSFFQRVTGVWNPSSNVRSVPRIHVLRRALLDLLDRRLRVSGSSSRIALIGFGTAPRLLFPYQEGMLPLDQSTPPESLRRFRDIIATLQADMGETRIGLAISFAASHLSKYGNPKNERLIVLLSDGADWAPAKDEQTGEILEQVSEEPVSLMEHLHEAMKIHLHAIGISNDRVYDDYLRRIGKSDQQIGNRPNHALLERLVQVGGGDPARTGDAQVVEEYFHSLAGGITRQVDLRGIRREIPRMTPEERSRVEHEVSSAEPRSEAPGVAEDQETKALANELEGLYQEVNLRCMNLVGTRLFEASIESYIKLQQHISASPANYSEFTLFLFSLWSVFDDQMIPSVRHKRETPPPPLDEIREYLYSSRFNDIQILRNFGAHDVLSGSKAGENAMRIGEILNRYTGQTYIAADDAQGWSKLQKSLLEVLRDVLKMIIAKLEAFERTQGTKEPPEQGIVIRGW